MFKTIIFKIVGMCLLISLFMITTASADHLIESDHPYANNFKYTWPAITEPGETQIRLHFSKLELRGNELGVAGRDILTLFDQDRNTLKVYEDYGGVSKEDMWTEWFTGDTIKVELATNGASTAYGFKIDQIETRTSMTPSADLSESYHPYANNYKYTWPAITEPGATQIRLHFSKLELRGNELGVSGRDILTLFDQDRNTLKVYEDYGGVSNEDMWTEWFTGDTIKVELTTNEASTAYGFKIDQTEPRTSMAPSADLPESYHPYANNFKYTWPAITEPGATQIRLHFSKLELRGNELGVSGRDILTLFDQDRNTLKVYEDYGGVSNEDMWTEWFSGDTIKVELTTNGASTAYGFKIDQIETRGTIIPTDKSVSTTRTITPTTTPQLSPTPTTEGISSDAPLDQPSVTSASVHLHGEKTDVVIGEDILMNLAAVNLITKPTMHVQVIITPPSGMSVTSSEFVQSGAGLFTASYEIEPGVGRDIVVRMRSNQVGDFVVNGRIVYYFGDDMEHAEDHTLTLPIKVRAAAESIENPTERSSESEGASTPGFAAVVAVIGLLLVYMRRKA